MEENLEEKQEVKEEQNLENNSPQEESLKQKFEEQEDRLKRLMAEFDNYKKRSSKERDNLYNSLLSDIVSSFLPVIDNLEKAVNSKTEDEGYKQGIELVEKQFLDVLSSFGVKEIECDGQTFDPELHEAVSSVQDETKGEKEIVQVYRKGYQIGTRVIRHAMVVVAN